ARRAPFSLPANEMVEPHPAQFRDGSVTGSVPISWWARNPPRSRNPATRLQCNLVAFVDRSVPGIRRVRDGVRDAPLVARQPERVEAALAAAEGVVGYGLGEPDRMDGGVCGCEVSAGSQVLTV